jgi:gamma-glutamylcyclotransferase (GGCT)/AIG2-like uncharacterized protein YtfP
MNTCSSQEQLPVFVYGTLRPGQKNYPHYLQGRTLREEPARCRGRIYFLPEGGYPYLTSATGEVRGDLMTLSPQTYEQTLAALDELEEYYPQDEPGSIYLRRVAMVAVGDRQVRAWVYYWNRMVTGVPIPSGDYADVVQEGR